MDILTLNVSYFNITADGHLEDHQTNLTALSSICDEFRMHLNHWICIKHRVQQNRWLRAILPSISAVMDQICQQFVRLQETAFWWVVCSLLSYYAISGVLNLFMVRANMKTGLSDGGHEYTYLGSSVKVAVLLVCTQKICELIQISLTLNLFA